MVQCSANGESATRKSIVYRIPLDNDTVLRLIDTPGIGDTRGFRQDALNKEDILATLRNVNMIHGILILLKPTNSRLDIMFRFCITELLTHLHQDAVSNIRFGFTNTRSSFYLPGDTFNPLKALLDKYNNPKLVLSDRTTYCFDSESFRFLAVLAETNTEMPRLSEYRDSWERSVNESKRLLAHWAALRGHRVKSTLNLNKVRDHILAIVEPLSKLREAAQETIAKKEETIEWLKVPNRGGLELRSRLLTEIISFERVSLGKPRTVCSNQSCRITRVDSDGSTVHDYRIVCHDECRMPVGIEHIGESSRWLLICSAFSHGLRQICNVCYHSWKEHLHIKDTYLSKTLKTVNSVIKRLLDGNASEANIQATAIPTFEAELRGWRKEKRELEHAYTAFGRYLKQNSIAPYNDEAPDYIDYQIRAQKNLPDRPLSAAGSSDRNSISSLESTLSETKRNIEAIEESMKSPDTDIPTDEQVDEILQNLYSLKTWGPALREAVQKSVSDSTYREQAFHAHLEGGRSLTSTWGIAAQGEAIDTELPMLTDTPMPQGKPSLVSERLQMLMKQRMKELDSTVRLRQTDSENYDIRSHILANQPTTSEAQPRRLLHPPRGDHFSMESPRLGRRYERFKRLMELESQLETRLKIMK